MSYSQDIANINNPSFGDILRISANNIPVTKRACPWVGLFHGVKLLETEDELAQYICAYGKMHKEKIDKALDSIKKPFECFTKEMTIIDWGCGQGLASICFLDYIHNLGIVPKVIKIILIEPSSLAIKRAKENLSKYIDSNKLVIVNKYINEVLYEDIEDASNFVIHFFSNILDIQTVDINHIADLINNNISSEQLFFCVGPQNIGASRISEFAHLFNIDDDDLIEEHSGKLTGRGTINLLVFKIKAKIIEIIKVEYLHHRNISIENCTYLRRVLNNIDTSGDISEKALQFYRSAIELERMKSVSANDVYSYPIKYETVNGITKINIDIQENSDFESLFKKNSNPAYEKWPKNLNIRVGIILGDKLFLLLQYLYPYEDIKNIDIENQYISIDLSSFSLNNDVADELEIGEEQLDVIESIISDKSTTWELLESILKDAISNDVILDSHIYLSLSAENPSYSQISSELKQLISKKDGTLLNQFLKGNISENSTDIYDEDTLIQVTPIDDSQRKAIASALSSKISVITGPPGTGKTQMILNLVANAFMKGKTVLVASKNNKAVDNIKERYDCIDSSRYLLRFGSKDAVKSQVIPYLDNMQNEISLLSVNDKRYNELFDEYTNCCKNIHDAREILLKFITLEDEYKCLNESIRIKKNEQDNIKSKYSENVEALLKKHNNILEISRYEIDWHQELTRVKMHINKLQSNYSGIRKLFFNLFSKKKQSEATLNYLLQMPNPYITMVESLSHISCVADVKNGQDLILLYDIEKSIIEKVLSCDTDFNNLKREHDNKLKTCEAELEKFHNRQSVCKKQIDLITASHTEIIDAIEKGLNIIKDISVEFFNMAVLMRLKGNKTINSISRYKNYLPDRIPWRTDEVSQYIADAKSFLDVFRLNAVTNLSIKNSYPLLNGIFDIVIIDESSQCDVASALPLIYRAKQLVVIGDPLQLKHISAINSDEEMAIKDHLNFSENPLVKYADYSLWDYCCDLIATSNTNNRPVVLDSHYRCHPQIIGYSNRMFYEKRLGTTLNVKTKEKNPMLKHKGIIWEDVKGVQKSELQNINDAEVNKCISIATQLASQYQNISIGIISPFKHQAQEINAHIPPDLANCIVADTVHKFQGDERDVIIYSLVVTDNSPDSKIHWIDYSVPNLVNVAVTRARTALYIVGNKEYIKKHSRIDLPLGNLVDYTETYASAPSTEFSKTYIIDTNVFIKCPNIIDYISPLDNIVLSAKVVDELDKLKVTLNEDKQNVEAALRHINSKYNERHIRMEFSDFNYLPMDFSRKNPDNLILSIAVKFRNQNAILLTNDNGFQVKAKGLGLKTIQLRDFIKNRL